MKAVLMLLTTLVLAGCATLSGQTMETEYSAKDAGQVVIGIGAAAGTEYTSYRFYYGRSAFNPGNQEDLGIFAYYQGYQPFTKADYRDEVEEGVVVTARLAPGEYEITNFSATLPLAAYTTATYFAATPFSIRFTVKPGVTTYLGNYQAVASGGQRSTGATNAGAPVFLVQDKHERDLALARSRTPGIFQVVDNATPEAKALHREFFVDKVPQEILDKQRGRVNLKEFLWGG